MPHESGYGLSRRQDRPRADTTKTRPRAVEEAIRVQKALRREDSARADSVRRGNGRFRREGRIKQSVINIFKRFFPKEKP